MIIPKTWKYIGHRTDIHDHCQICNRETSNLHWYRIDKQTVATICNNCKMQSDKEGDKE